MSLRKSSSSKKGSNSFVFPKPKARCSLTPAPSMVGCVSIICLTGLNDIAFTFLRYTFDVCRAVNDSGPHELDFQSDDRIIADENAAGFRRRVPRQPEVFMLDPS